MKEFFEPPKESPRYTLRLPLPAGVKLPADYTRCTDAICPLAPSCLRYQCQNVHERTPYTTTFRKSNSDEECDGYINSRD